MNYELRDYQSSKLIRLDIFVNSDRVESLSMIVHHDKAYHTGKNIVERLKELIPKHLFTIPVQAGIGNKMIARETIPAIRKDVIAKCYGGDVSRKKKLLAKQKEGKKKMKAIGKVNVPQDIFIKMLKR
jgi:GTP-binding protein LepA